jgi:hypothetical protein
VLGAVTLGATAVFVTDISSYGFPDGHRTELERAYATLSRYVLPPVALLGVYCLYLGVIAGGRSIISRRLAIVIASIAVVATTAWLVCSDLRGSLDDGAGG